MTGATPQIIEVLKNCGTTYEEAKKNKNFDTIVAGIELSYLSLSDVVFMLLESTTENQAVNRLITRRRSSSH